MGQGRNEVEGRRVWGSELKGGLERRKEIGGMAWGRAGVSMGLDGMGGFERRCVRVKEEVSPTLRKKMKGLLRDDGARRHYPKKEAVWSHGSKRSRRKVS